MLNFIGYHGTTEEGAKSLLRDGVKAKRKANYGSWMLGSGFYCIQDYEAAKTYAEYACTTHLSNTGQELQPVVLKVYCEGLYELTPHIEHTPTWHGNPAKDSNLQSADYVICTAGDGLGGRASQYKFNKHVYSRLKVTE